MGPSSASPEHRVAFFDRDDVLCHAAADFVAEGLNHHERVLVLATADHWATIGALLGQVSPDVIFVDADEILRQIVVEGAIDTRRFGALMLQALAGVTRPCRVFGELASLVAARGMMHTIIEIEDYGHVVARESGGHVLCAYDLRHLGSAGDRQSITLCHDRVVTAASSLGRDGPLVLVADDFEDARELYRDYLHFRGCRTITAMDGSEAVELAHARQPDIMFLDIRMPRMSGIEAMQELKAHPRFVRVPIVALTAHALTPERTRLLAKGFDAVLSKPCPPERLVETIESFGFQLAALDQRFSQ
jgi:two-component system, cell cycle response regulator DivK